MSLETNSRLLKTQEVAELLGLSVNYVKALVHSGELGCCRISAHKWRFTSEQISTFIEKKSGIAYSAPKAVTCTTERRA